MALPATDTFTGSNGDPLSANWTVLQGSFAIFNNQANEAAFTLPNLGMWNADAFANNQYAQVNVGSTQGGGPAVRLTGTSGGGDADGYFVRVVNGGFTELDLMRVDNGAWTSLQTWTGLTIATGALLRLEVSGTTLSVYNAGALVGTASDATYSSGAAGIAIWGQSGTLIDNFEGGNISSGNRRRRLLLCGR